MTFTLRLVSDWEYSKTVTYNTLEELKALQEQENHRLIVDFKSMTIFIYDDYIE